VIDLLRIHVDGSGDVFRPGDTVSGSVEWALERAPNAIEVRLFWYTEGRGDRDAGLARSMRIEAPGATGSQSFDLELPTGPYSFSGRLISLIWALEAVVEPGDRSTREEIVVSPGDGEVQLARTAS
jgi:hypothetical protein